MASNTKQAVLVPLKLDAFVFNAAVCDGIRPKPKTTPPPAPESGAGNNDEPDVNKTTAAKIAPIVQPNYTFLRLDDDYIQADILNHVDLHHSWPSTFNSRFTDLGEFSTRERRQGVYLHWTIPRMYRSAVAAAGKDTAASAAFAQARAARGYENTPVEDRSDGDKGKDKDGDKKIDPSAPAFPNVPTRWLVIRHIADKMSIKPEAAQDKVKDFTAWVVESDRLWELKDLAEDCDLQVDVSPFISANEGRDVLKIKLDKKDADPAVVFKDWLEASDETRIVCHGAMYNVQWDRDAKPKSVPADDFATQLNNTLPLAVGTTPMDALTTYARAHKLIDPAGTPRQLEEYISQLERHLLARDDGVEAQQQATDLLYNWNYLRVDGGQVWNVAGKNDNERPVGTPDVLGTLRDINKRQQLLDAVVRTTARLRWELFAAWWKVVTSPKKDHDPDSSKTLVEGLQDRIEALVTRRGELEKEITDLAGPDETKRKVQPGARPPFYQQRDPTLLVGGVRSGWPLDYLDELQIRLESQVVAAGAGDPVWTNFDTEVLPKLPPNLGPTIQSLVTEFIALRPETTSEPVLSDNMQTPLFHDRLSHRRGDKIVADGPWRDRWEETQPWFPLFLEWEIEYHHIPFELWHLEPRRSRTLKAAKLRYGIGKDTNLSTDPAVNTPDKHTIQGRVLILPQPSFSLEAKIKQLFADTPSMRLDEKDGGFLDHAARELLTNELHRLAFLSAPLAGLTAHLTTVLQGSHIKPNLRDGRTGAIISIKDAERKSHGFGKEQLQLMGIETDSTPFDPAVKPPSTAHPLFKPATHGQFRFTRLNIIDKFGQAIHAIDPTPMRTPQRVWPCISEWYAPQLLRDDTVLRQPNVVVVDPKPTPKPVSLSFSPASDDYDAHPTPCEFVQIPPQLNQEARLNATFVVRADKVYPDSAPIPTSTPDNPKPEPPLPFWRPADEWENPIWGWAVINLANMGIQLFLPSGTFYREVRLGAGKTGGAQPTPEWLPFDPPAATDARFADPEMRQLQLLVQRLGDDSFLRAFWEMIVRATGRMEPAPDAYASFSNALIGRPLALVNAGWSLELATDALGSQVVRDHELPLTLLPTEGEDDKGQCYMWGVKLGDSDRGFDGLVGYFNTREGLANEKKTGDLGLVLDTVISDFATPEGAPGPPVPAKQITIPAFYESPETHLHDADGYAQRRNAHLTVVGMLVDPFAPVHAYSGVLPVRALPLPPWTWQAALVEMKAFFHAGPLVVTMDVPAVLNPEQRLRPGKEVVLPEVRKGEGAVGLPAVAGGDWAWLQPYYPASGEAGGKGGEEERYAVLPLASVDERARFEEGPYTAIEGYVMMVASKEGKQQ
ncbi:hypothetical protein B0T22DRAFT_403811 [Podospora appendiculata]|uniref:Uncharacterized protein n=1 Tax=Podospora appendiculata TaxID=314037 RepID=A0AAE0XBT8_9PEZI|nr:hypothetical protein B0T22DRAFT_403811 [Podospora appendiculata]